MEDRIKELEERIKNLEYNNKMITDHNRELKEAMEEGLIKELSTLRENVTDIVDALIEQIIYKYRLDERYLYFEEDE